MNYCEIGMEEVVALAAVAEHLPELRMLFMSYEEHRYRESEEDRRKYGGEEGLKILFNAPWKSLERFEFNKIPGLAEDVA